jgi:1-acyl-sn-glycerol-3-phosphate acyltransferase
MAKTLFHSGHQRLNFSPNSRSQLLHPAFFLSQVPWTATLPSVPKRQVPLGNRFLAGFVRSVLWLRYRVRVVGLKEVVERGRTGILFLQNHPALIDPVILTSRLMGTFRPRPLGDETQIDRFFVRWLARRVNVLPIPDPGKVGTAGRDRI